MTEGKAFPELLKLAIDHAPDEEARAKLQAILDKHGGPVTNDTGDAGPPPPKQ